MADIIDDLYPAVRAIVAATWPECVASGIWEAEHVDRIPYADLTPPYAVIAIDTVPAVDFGGTLDSFQPTIEVYYVAESKGPMSGVRLKLEALRKALNKADDTVLCVTGVTGLTWGRSLFPNQVFTQKRMTHAAGRLSFQVLVRESLDAN